MSALKHRAGRHFLQIPGPTSVPDRVLRAIDAPTIDHRGPSFQALGQDVLAGIKTIFKTEQPVIIYPASGTGAWEAAMVNTLSPGDRVLMVETGHFSSLWHKMAKKLGLEPIYIEGDWRSGVDAAQIAQRLRDDGARTIRAVCVVHNETSTGVTSDILAVRRAMTAAEHPALLMVDTISSLGSVDYRHDEWGIDVSVGGSQKGLMLPPGLSFTALSAKALEAKQSATMPCAFWDWTEMLNSNKNGFFPYTPSTNLLFGLREAIKMLHEEGLNNVFARHRHHAEATRRAVKAWGLEIVARNQSEQSPVLTAVQLPEGCNADRLREVVLERYDMSLGMGLGKLAGKVFRIGHLGDTNDLTIVGALGGVEMGLRLLRIPHNPGGVTAAMEYLSLPQ